MGLGKRLKQLGPGLVTGAADDDPSGIATYSQAGAQFGTSLLWTMTLTYPLMVAVQLASARIGRVTGHGLGHNLKAVMPRWLVIALVALLFVANTVNVGADLAAMGDASALVAGWSKHGFTVGFAVISLLLQLFVPYRRYSSFLKWLTLVLLAYVALVFIVKIDWMAAVRGLVIPEISGSGAATVLVAIFGTTISPYLFFWQAAQEVEELDQVKAREPLVDAKAPGHRLPHAAPISARAMAPGFRSRFGVAGDLAPPARRSAEGRRRHRPLVRSYPSTTSVSPIKVIGSQIRSARLRFPKPCFVKDIEGHLGAWLKRHRA